MLNPFRVACTACSFYPWVADSFHPGFPPGAIDVEPLKGCWLNLIYLSRNECPRSPWDLIYLIRHSEGFCLFHPYGVVGPMRVLCSIGISPLRGAPGKAARFQADDAPGSCIGVHWILIRVHLLSSVGESVPVFS